MTPTDRCVRDVMSTDIVTVAPDMTVVGLARMLREEGLSGAPVVDGNRVVGVVSDSDILRLAVEEGALEELVDDTGGSESEGYFRSSPGVLGRLGRFLPTGVPGTRLKAHSVGDIMTSATFSVRPKATLSEAARFLASAGIERALVFDDGRLVGVVTTFDVLKGLTEGERSLNDERG